MEFYKGDPNIACEGILHCYCVVENIL